MGQYVEPVFRKKIKKYKKGDFQELHGQKCTNNTNSSGLFNNAIKVALYLNGLQL